MVRVRTGVALTVLLVKGADKPCGGTERTKR